MRWQVGRASARLLLFQGAGGEARFSSPWAARRAMPDRMASWMAFCATLRVTWQPAFGAGRCVGLKAECRGTLWVPAGCHPLMPHSFPKGEMPAEIKWGRPPGLRGTPSSRSFCGCGCLGARRGRPGGRPRTWASAPLFAQMSESGKTMLHLGCHPAPLEVLSASFIPFSGPRPCATQRVPLAIRPGRP
jgi:hypothetical protein